MEEKPYFGIIQWTIPEKNKMILEIELTGGVQGVTNTVKRYDDFIRDIHEALHNKGYITSMGLEERTQAEKTSSNHR